MQKQQLLKILSLSLLLTACGSNSSNNNNSNLEDKIGYFIDSAVVGVDYKCSSKIDLTGDDGKFACSSLPVSFYIGSTKLGSITQIPKDNKIFPQDIVGVDREKVDNSEVVKLATLLQSLDSDGDASNGITISPYIRKEFTSEEETSLEDIELTKLEELHPNITFLDQESVVAHLSLSLENAIEDEVIAEENRDNHESSTSSNSTTTETTETITSHINNNDNNNSISEEETDKNEIKLPTEYTNSVINNEGKAVIGNVNGYTIRIYSDEVEKANPQSLHQGVVVKLNGNASENIAIQATYLNKKIIIALYNNAGELVKISDEILVTDVPIVIVELNL